MSSNLVIPNASQYSYIKQYVSIHSEDRDFLKYPNSAEFEIQLPQDYLNVQSAKLVNWSFPSNYDVFSVGNGNLDMIFQITEPYNPNALGVEDLYQKLVYTALQSNIENNFIITIETGFYDPPEMASELTTKMNDSITKYLYEYFSNNGEQFKYALQNFKYYNEFVVAYNAVSQRLWFGNKSSRFVISNDDKFYFESRTVAQTSCVRQNALLEFYNWGLPDYLGFTRCPANSYPPSDENVLPFTGIYIYPDGSVGSLPRFYYDGISPTDGFWLIPDLPKATVYFLRVPDRFNFFGPNYIYMEVSNLNCIDETSPYNVSEFTLTTNGTNGIVNSCFSKISVNTTSTITQLYDNTNIPYKWFNPPAERIRKLKIKFRYHNGQLVKFGNFNYTFTIEFNLLMPQASTSKVNLLPNKF